MIDLPVGALVEVVESATCNPCIFYLDVGLCSVEHDSLCKSISFREVNKDELFGYDSDLSNVQLGDYVWVQTIGEWSKVTKIDCKNIYPVYCTTKAGTFTFTFDGRCHYGHKLPIAFTNPPACFNAGPMPRSEREESFKDGDKVIVSNNGDSECKRIYSHFKCSKGLHATYEEGRNEWTSNGKYEYWLNCRKVDEE